MKKRLNPRKKWSLKDPLAELGYYTTPVQKVVGRWRSKIGKDIFDQNIVSLMIACNYSVRCVEPTDQYFNHKRFALELALSIEKVRERWREKIGDKLLEIMLGEYITPLLSSISDLGSNLNLISKHRRFILELLLAVDEVLNDTKRKEGGILEFAFSGDEADYENGIPTLRSWSKVAAMIAKRSGLKKIEPNTVAQLAKRMRLTE